MSSDTSYTETDGENADDDFDTSYEFSNLRKPKNTIESDESESEQSDKSLGSFGDATEFLPASDAENSVNSNKEESKRKLFIPTVRKNIIESDESECEQSDEPDEPRDKGKSQKELSRKDLKQLSRNERRKSSIHEKLADERTEKDKENADDGHDTSQLVTNFRKPKNIIQSDNSESEQSDEPYDKEDSRKELSKNDIKQLSNTEISRKKSLIIASETLSNEETVPRAVPRKSSQRRSSIIKNFSEWNTNNLLSSTIFEPDIQSKSSFNPSTQELSTLVDQSELSSSNSVVIGKRPEKNEEVLDDDSDIIVRSDSESEVVIINSDNESTEKPINQTLKQLTIREMLNKPDNQVTTEENSKKTASKEEYFQQRGLLNKAQSEFQKLQNAIRTINIQTLPDRGAALIAKHKECLNRINIEEEKLNNMAFNHQEPSEPLQWNNIEEGATAIQPRTFGKQALNTYNTEKALSMDRLQALHGSLQSCPSTDVLADDPAGINVQLMIHQKHGLAWMQWRERQKPSGGILADDMGLGKTLSMLALVCHGKQTEESDDEEDENSDRENDEDETKYHGGTLIVCPASLMGQWAAEIQTKLKRGLLSFEMYHGPKRESKAKRLSKYDVVITTYSICQSEGQTRAPIYRIKWRRIIIDEGHQIRNYKSKTALAVFRLAAKSRWTLTGTPVHNNELDLFAQLKFLRCSPFDDLVIYKRWISSKNSGGNQRLHTVLSSLLLRRTKEELKQLNQITDLPEREWTLLEVNLSKEEMEVYQKILLFSKTLFAQFLYQRAEKDSDIRMESNYNKPNAEYFKMHEKLLKMNNIREVKQSHILVLLLRLRQICCHPSLITAMLENSDLESNDADSADVSIDLLQQLGNLDITDNEDLPAQSAGGEDVGLAEASRGLLNPSNPVFEKSRLSNKLGHVLKLVKEKIIANDDKGIVVSQWTSLLKLLAIHFDNEGIKYCNLDGSVVVGKRQEIVGNFNNPKTPVQIMLLSLTAGGVGLNLVGANHLIFLDLHWNPQLEQQAQDRIYRFGQRKKVHIYKFLALETIEERIKSLQDRKKELAETVLTGGRIQQTKLSLNDLKMLFDMGT